MKELRAACPNLTGWTVQQAVKQADFLRVFEPSYATQNEGAKTHKKYCRPKKGRPPKRFRVPFLKELYAELNVKPKTVQTISSQSRRNAAQFRAEVMAARIRHKPGEYAIKQLAKPMGISANTVRAYCRRADIEVTPRFSMKPIKTADDIQALPANAQELAEWRRSGKFKGAVWLETLDGKHKFAPTQEGAAYAGKRPIRLVKLLANHYKARERADN